MHLPDTSLLQNLTVICQSLTACSFSQQAELLLIGAMGIPMKEA